MPTGAVDGKVTVTTGSTTLTSPQTFIVHNSWGQGKAIPTPVRLRPRQCSVPRSIWSVVIPVQGIRGSTDNQIYSPLNTWSSGAALPTGTAQAAAAVVNNILYIFGGTNDGGVTLFNAVWAYNPKTNSWSSKAAMPTARCSVAATVEKSIIYVIGGYDNRHRLNTVETYNPATDTWTSEASLIIGKSETSAGLIGTTIVAADGYTGSWDNGDNEDYNAATNSWTSLTSDPTPRNGSCSGVIGGLLYGSDGNTNNAGAKPQRILQSEEKRLDDALCHVSTRNRPRLCRLQRTVVLLRGSSRSLSKARFTTTCRFISRRLISALSPVGGINSGKRSGAGSRRRKLSVAAS